MREDSEEARAEARSPRDGDMATSVGLGESLNCKMQNAKCKLQNAKWTVRDAYANRQFAILSATAASDLFSITPPPCDNRAERDWHKPALAHARPKAPPRA